MESLENFFSISSLWIGTIMKTTSKPIIPDQAISHQRRYPTMTTNNGAVHMAFKYCISNFRKSVFCLNLKWNSSINLILPLTLHQSDRRHSKVDSSLYQMRSSPMLHVIISKPTFTSHKYLGSGFSLSWNSFTDLSINSAAYGDACFHAVVIANHKKLIDC